MICFFTVAAPPRSGTMWFSRLFQTEHCFCFHELTTRLHPFPSNMAVDDWLEAQTSDHSFEQSQRRWILQNYPNYFARLWERAFDGQYIVGNSDSGVIKFLPGLWLLWPDMKFVFSVRNGINCVDSYFVNQSNVPELTLARMRRIQREHRTPEGYFALCCVWWVSHIEALLKARSWLADRGGSCIDTTLERVTTNADEIQRLWDWIGIGGWTTAAPERSRLQSLIVNPRVSKDRAVKPVDIWADWSPEQRDAFRTICGDAMSRVGYEVPNCR